jgi:hypothetical protein
LEHDKGVVNGDTDNLIDTLGFELFVEFFVTGQVIGRAGGGEGAGQGKHHYLFAPKDVVGGQVLPTIGVRPSYGLIPYTGLKNNVRNAFDSSHIYLFKSQLLKLRV